MMTDHDFLTSLRIKSSLTEGAWPQDADPLSEALRIDDVLSEYCERLEKRIAQQAMEIEVLRRRLDAGPSEPIRGRKPAGSDRGL